MSEPPVNDSRFRPFRGASWAVYLVVAVGFSSLIIYSVFLSVLRMTPSRPPVVTEVLPVSNCVAGARAMFDELDAARRAHTDAEAVSADHRFLDFRNDWVSRKLKLEAQCALDAPDRAALREALGTLDHLVDLYTTASVQFASAIGPSVEQFRAQLDALK